MWLYMVKVKKLNGEVVELRVGKIKVKELLLKLGLSTEEYVVVKSGQVITEEDYISDEDFVVLYPVVSGG